MIPTFQPIKTGSSEAPNPFVTNNKDNDNTFNGTGAIATNNDTEINSNRTITPDVSESTPTTMSSTQGKYNGLDFDIDVRIGDSK